MPGLYRSGNWNENNLNPLSSINWRASLVPAAAVIPAPIAYIKVVAVKKLVVGFLAGASGLTLSAGTWMSLAIFGDILFGIKLSGRGYPSFTVKKLELMPLNILAWNNKIGRRYYFVGLRTHVMINRDRRGYSYCIVRVRGSKMIRYHRSLNHKLCRLGIGSCFLTLSAPYEKSKSLGSGGSMVARLKLKEIDGRAPPGVEPAA
ncbi:hypothetical protein ACHAXN_003515 [Cyclotella atomus]